MAHRPAIATGTEPVNLVATERSGAQLRGQVTGPNPVIIRDAATGDAGSGFTYQPGEFFLIDVESGEGNWAHSPAGPSAVVLADR